MQSGLENIPYFVQQNYGVPIMIQPQGINIVLAPSLACSNINAECTTAADSYELTEVNENQENDDEEDDDREETENDDSLNSLTDEEIDCYKQKIYSHPLFALISFLFERCDQSTVSSVSQPIKNIDNDINNHFMKLHQEETPIFTEDSDVDNLMIETLKVLKIHLIELEKVHDLCKDFCSRYIRCLKTSMHSSQLVPMDLDDDNETSIEIPNADNSLMTPLKSPLISTNLISPISNLSQGQVVSGGTVYQMVQTPQGLVAQPIQIPTQVIDNTASQARNMHDTQLAAGALLNFSQHSQINADTQIFMNSDDDSHHKKSKRGVLPKKATKVMKAWLFQHLSHPYPNEDEKRQIASQTNLTILQVNNWFINGRRRILQPMMNSSNELGKHKPKRHNKKSAQRFWPPTSSTEQAGGEEEEEEEEDNEEETDEEQTDVGDQLTEHSVVKDLNKTAMPLPSEISSTSLNKSGNQQKDSSPLLKFQINKTTTNKSESQGKS